MLGSDVLPQSSSSTLMCKELAVPSQKDSSLKILSHSFILLSNPVTVLFTLTSFFSPYYLSLSQTMLLIWIFTCPFSVTSIWIKDHTGSNIASVVCCCIVVLEGPLVPNRCPIFSEWINKCIHIQSTFHSVPTWSLGNSLRKIGISHFTKQSPFYSWGNERLYDFHKIIWLLSVRAAGTSSWILTLDPSPTLQISSSPLPSGPTQRRLSVSASIGGETGLMSCVLPEDLFTQILADRIQVYPCLPAQSCTVHTPSLSWDLRLQPTAHSQQLRTQGSWRGKMGFFTPNSHLLLCF